MSTPGSSATDRRGRIVTFYSYKGGTGRSMAVANIAWILASQAQRVLVIDWDLEAPGLHRYFHPFVADPELASSPGIIDFLTAFVEGAHQAEPDESGRWFQGYTDLEPYMFSLDWEFPGGGTLDVVPAGQQGPSYAARVTGFDWQGFYERLGGGVFLEAVKQALRREYDWIFVDSRTGISDTSGICTVQMPDDLVVCFTLNDQSMTGAAAVTRSAVAQRTKPDGTPGLRVFPVRTRVERAESARLNAAKDLAFRTFTPFLSHLDPLRQGEYWGSVEVLYHPFYAYEEVLAPFGDPPQESGSMLSAMETLTAYLTDGAVKKLGDLPEERRLKERDRFFRTITVPGPFKEAEEMPAPVEITAPGTEEPASRQGRSIVAPSEDWLYWAYLSYSRHDTDAYLQQFVRDLGHEIRMRTGTGGEEEIVFFDQRAITEGADPAETVRALQTSRTGVPLYSPAYFHNDYCGREFTALLERSRHRQARGPTGIVPILWGPPSFQLPSVAAEIQYLSSDFPAEYVHEGLRSMMRRTGRRNVYGDVILRLAEMIVESATEFPLPVVELPPLERLGSAFEPVDGIAIRDASVQAVYVAGDRAMMQPLRRDLAAYGKRPLDWCPFRSTPVHALAETTAAAEKLFLDVVPFDLHLGQRILAVEQSGTPLAIIVDPWCLELPSHFERLRDLDGRLPPNVAVFVLWDSSEETELKRAELQDRVSMAFAQLEGWRSRRYYPHIDSDPAFIRAFATTIVSINSELMARRDVFSNANAAVASDAF